MASWYSLMSSIGLETSGVLIRRLRVMRVLRSTSFAPKSIVRAWRMCRSSKVRLSPPNRWKNCAAGSAKGSMRSMTSLYRRGYG